MWALDLGTTNSLLVRWDPASDRPRLLELPSVCRHSDAADPLEAPRVVPSAVHVLDDHSFWTRLGQRPLFARHLFLGKPALIGRPAMELNALRPRRNFVPSFKRALSMSPLMPVARAAGRTWSAREVARLFLRELFAEAKEATGERIRELVLTAPVETFETYRAELSSLAKGLGVHHLRFIDEPVAAALGYGLGVGGERRVLVVDFGGGTLHVALVHFAPGALRDGRSRVVAKAGRDVGGNLVDRWFLDALARRLELELPAGAGDDDLLWDRQLLADACRVKEALHFKDTATFEPALPEDRRRFEARLRDVPRHLEVTRDDLLRVLEERGLFRTLDECLTEVLAAGAAAGLTADAIDDVLVVGGSSLLPGVYPLLEERFGRGRVRAWQPFEAIATGACVFAAGRAEPADFIVHDYALVTTDARTNAEEHTIIVPRGTRFPTPPDAWKRRFVPTCSLGEPERTFKLVICEIGSDDHAGRFAWDADGRLHKRSAPGAPRVVKLNAANPALGTLDPPHSPRDTRPRLEIAFGVNAERWLCATVLDLSTGRQLMRDEPVVRLL